jgi:HSP20 family protein
MMPMRWDPWRDFMSMKRQIDRMFDDFLRRSEARETEEADWCPIADVYETDNEFRIVMEVPGMKKEDFKISVHDGVLTIRGERKRETKSTENFLISERIYGKFQRSFTLPNNVDTEKISASYRDGVLTLTLPKKEESKPKEIPISVG